MNHNLGKILLSGFLLLLSFSSWSQQATKTGNTNTLLEASAGASHFASTIIIDDLRYHLSHLASEEFEGRETGTAGQHRAALYIAQQFKEMGLLAVADSGTYLQKIRFSSERWASDKLLLSANGTVLQPDKDFYSDPRINQNRGRSEIKELVFLGYGIDDKMYSDYKGKDLRGKHIVILDGEPADEDGTSWITKEKKESKWSTDKTLKLSTAYQLGVSTVFIVGSDFSKNVQESRRQGQRMLPVAPNSENSAYPNSFVISEEAMAKISNKFHEDIKKAAKEINTNGNSKSFTFQTNLIAEQQKSVTELNGSNVLGYIRGSDPKLADELVVITAHYDHLGKRGNQIYYGADDNASGTSAVMEIAQAFQIAVEKGQGPRRSMLFMLVSGEEKGLLGSLYYSEYPVFPLQNTIANLNVDMIGRRDEKHKDDPSYIYVIGADRLSTTLHQINETANETYSKLTLDYTFNDRNDPQRLYYRSDHYNFAKKKIPSIFYFSGLHQDYHRTSDTIDKIEFDKMVPITQLIFYTAWELANRNEKPKVDVFED